MRNKKEGRKNEQEREKDKKTESEKGGGQKN